jgi:LacI family transcriptional regulator
VVNVSAVCPAAFPRVGVDHEALGAMAGRHLVERGYRHFACVFRDDITYAAQRERGFRRAVETTARSYRVLNRRAQILPDSPLDRESEARRWLRSLPKPCGLFIASLPGWSRLAAKFAGVRVPQNLGIVDVGDDDLVAEMHAPPLTTVDYPGVQIGMEAARLLDRLMKGGRPPAQPILLPPTGVTVRRSTEHLVLSDGLAVKAIDLIRQKAGRRFAASEIADQCGVSRRTLERRFRAAGQSMAGVIRMTQIDHACRLLAETDLPLKQVTARCGLSSVHRLCKLVRQAKGTTPSQYRRQFGRRAL